MFGAFGTARAHGGVTFVSQAAMDNGLRAQLGVARALLPVRGTRRIGKADMIHNSLTPHITVDPETYEVRVDGALITCEPASVLPMAQRYFLY
jgi:urease subunit alpha